MTTRPADSWRRVKSTWQQQAPIRKVAIQEILLNRIQCLTRNTSVQSFNSKPVYDHFANSLDDLPVAELEKCKSRLRMIESTQSRQNLKVRSPLLSLSLLSNAEKNFLARCTYKLRAEKSSRISRV